ncbi:polysaccharide lyase [Winogradskyella haliclonae]|uniref:Polysaccharide lyase-like protein n=1 Tax=Winogradskyella haliclonae TaxID=2048558 RepID=A0ABQ2C2Z7_9FLAO|nr:polysaccharide lyase [Winogradskyella haliclonae]GGI58128.1 hypothetical protein GCM10011444_24370 [Winogradskyella haliclonae]
MNRFYLYLFVLVVLSCAESDEPTEVISTDISVTSSTNSITWTDDAGLLQQLDNALSYNFGSTLESEIEKQQVFNTDSTEVTASIKFSAGFENVYKDTNPFNNSVTISLIREVPAPQGIELKADGSGSTYELITSVLAPDANPIETPDCNHASFGRHIDEIFDNDINTNVFRFFMHTTPDNDRCINFDRQRNEIKTYDQSPDNLKGVQNETVVYKWKFKLPSGFQTSPNFTHLHQLKSVGGNLASMPMYTLTARKSSPDRLELRYAETDTQVTLTQTPITPFLNTWVEVTETIIYGTNGTYAIEIKSINDGSVLFEYSNNSIINWRPNADFVRPKWGIYRSLINSQDLRNEEVLFADFSITEL